MGAWAYVSDRIMTATRALNGKVVVPAYVGRDTSAAPGTGWAAVHKVEQEFILETALSDKVTNFMYGIDDEREVGWRSSNKYAGLVIGS